MIHETTVRELISDVFEEEALVIGGLVATHEVEDDMVWSLVRSLDVIRRRALARVEQTAPQDPPSTAPAARPHPAIEDFLRRIREDAAPTTL